MLVGRKGVGKRFSVRQAAIEHFSQDGRDFHEHQIKAGVHPDYVELGADLGVDAVRGLVAQTQSMPMLASHKYLVIDGADEMTEAAANALLKTLEEPPDFCRFFLLTDSESRVMPTVRSRCCRVRYSPLPEHVVVEGLSEYEEDPVKRVVYARLAEGSVGEAVQFWSAGKIALRNRVFQLMTKVMSADLPAIMTGVDELAEELSLAIRFYDHLLHDLLVMSFSPDRISNLDLADELAKLRKGLGPRLGLLYTDWRGMRTVFDRPSLVHEFHLKTHLLTLFSG